MLVLVLDVTAAGLRCAAFDTDGNSAIAVLVFPGASHPGSMIRQVPELLAEAKVPLPQAVAHRIVVAPDRRIEAVHIDDAALDSLKASAVPGDALATRAMDCIRAAREQWPGLPQVAVFDHATPDEIGTANTDIHAFAVAPWNAVGLAGLAHHAKRLLQRERAHASSSAIPLAVSGRHVHLTESAALELFGNPGAPHLHHALKQPGHWAATETVDLVGPHGEIHNVRVLGPCRSSNQIEISHADAGVLGIDVPVRLSGRLSATPRVTLRAGQRQITTDGVIVARRHLHTNAADAQALGLQDAQTVSVRVRSGDRSLIFEDVVVRIDPSYVTELHIDVDEANAAGIEHHHLAVASLVDVPDSSARPTP